MVPILKKKATTTTSFSFAIFIFETSFSSLSICAFVCVWNERKFEGEKMRKKWCDKYQTVDQTYLAWRIVWILKSSLKIDSHFAVTVWCVCLSLFFFLFHMLSCITTRKKKWLSAILKCYTHVSNHSKPIQFSIYFFFALSSIRSFVCVHFCVCGTKEILKPKLWSYFKIANTNFI